MQSHDCRYGHMHHRPLSVHVHDHEEDDHHHDHVHVTNDKKLLKISFYITFTVMFVEILGGLYANSLALVSDAIHMFTHSFALGLSLFALVIAAREADEHRSFGYYRAEIIAALINGITIALSIVWIVYEAVLRFLNPEVILSGATFVVAFIGLVVNIITGMLLFRADQNNINIRSAFLHMLSDTLSSVAIIIGAVIIHYTDLYVIDTALALLVALVISKWAYSLISDSVHILLEGSPVDVNALKEGILVKFDNVLDVHDMHCWQISRNNYYFTAHVVVEDFEEYDKIIVDLAKYLEDDFHIGHTTFQIERR